MKRIVEHTGTVLLLAALALVVAGQLLGVRAVPVLSGSMTPYAPTGSLVLTTPLDGDDVRVGDVVAFVPPAPFGGSHPVMHRVAGVTAEGGARAMTTRGDANARTDPWAVALDGADLGRAVFVVPLLGRFAMAGPGAVVMMLVGGVAVAGAVRVLRRSDCDCPSPAVDQVEVRVETDVQVEAQAVAQVEGSAPGEPAAAPEHTIHLPDAAPAGAGAAAQAPGRAPARAPAPAAATSALPAPRRPVVAEQVPAEPVADRRR